ncbi:MAG: imidazoleglycerol-phosphate dehydratase [Thaumarchaeota archaeon]|nr:imidazoleglycerol-phosphate dehydratase [Nitrososphaerota archaeon]MCY3976111.1 imidazoleglycerol-phosphate dehydratase [Nitrososphaerota archaeon]
MKCRTNTLKRETKETNVYVCTNIDGTGNIDVNTGIKFLDHLIKTFCKYSLVDITLKVKSKDQIIHHIVEDIAICIGKSINKSLGDRSNITRFGFASIPMDESIVETTIDLITRTYCKIGLNFKRNMIEDIYKEDILHFFDSLLKNMKCCTHISLKYGDNDHHIAEAAIKSLAVAFRFSSSIDNRLGVPSTKEVM